MREETTDGGGGKTWTFSELTGVLELTLNANFASWENDNGVTGGPQGDSDQDGIVYEARPAAAPEPQDPPAAAPVPDDDETR